MSAIYAKEYEDYLVSRNEASLSTLIPGSLEHQYFYLTKKILNESFTKELKAEIESFVKLYPYSNTFRIQCLSLLKEFDEPNQDQEKLIKQLIDLFQMNVYTTHKKPDTRFGKVNTQILNKAPSKYDNSLIDEEAKNKLIYEDKENPTNIYMNKTYKAQKPIFCLEKISEDLLMKSILDQNQYSIFINCLFFQFQNYSLSTIKAKLDAIFKKAKPKEVEKIAEGLRKQIFYFTYEIIEYLITCKDYFNVDEFIYELIFRKYAIKCPEKEDKIKVLKEILEIIKTAPLKFFKMRESVLLNILSLQSQLNIYDLNLFIDYLKEVEYVKKQPVNNKLKEPTAKLDQYLKNVGNLSEVLQNHLFHFFYVDNTPVETFTKYMDFNIIKDVYYRAKIYRGDDSINKEISSDVLAKYINDTSLKICNYNKTKFSIEDKVELFLEIKNIKTLFVKIYEINTSNYYYNNKCSIQVNNKLSVEGLIPTYEDIYSFDEKPQLLIVRKFSFDKIPLQRGIFIIEFIGNGVASRAIVKKGGLSLIHRDTVDGKVFYILNEKQEICKGETTGIWMGNQYFKGISSGEILIPYQHNNEEDLIFTYENFSELTKVRIPQEQYSLQGTWICNKEAIIMGNICQFLVRPFLYVNNQLTDIAQLKKVGIELNVEKEENGQKIPIIIPFEKVTLTQDKEYQFEFQIPPKITKIEMILKGEVKAKSNEQTFNLSIKDSITLNNKSIERIFLTKQGSDYIAEIRGKNGELIPSHQIKFNVIHNVLVTTQVTLESDENGQINLGSLQNVKSIVLETYTFYLEESQISYNNHMLLVEGDELKLPIYKETKIGLFQFIDNKVNINISQRIQYVYTDDEKIHGYMIVKNLTEGSYEIQLSDSKITLDVIKGKYWDDDNFILTDKEIINSSKSIAPIAIEKFEYKDKTLKIKVNKGNNCRIHLQAMQYCLNRNNAITETMINCLKSNVQKDERFILTQWSNVFLNNKILSDEIQYVLDRKQFERTLGNSLEKPSLIMKRQFIRDTNTSIKTGGAGSDYSQNEAMDADSMPMMAKYSSGQSSQFPSSNFTLGSSQSNNFIITAPMIKNNLIPNEAGEIVLQLDLSEYSVIHVICVENLSCCEETITLPKDKLKTRDLRMTGALNPEKNYTELKKVHHLNKEGEYKIQDITSIHYKVFDSIEKYWKYLEMACNINTHKAELSKFSFLIQFDLMNLAEKTEKISEFFCHEFNVYVYFHHPEIFKEFILPVLKYKIEKTFIDYFLLDDMESIKYFTTPDVIESMNTFEKCLLIYAIRKSNPSLAKNIALTIKANAQKTKLPEKEITELFNLALNVNILEEKPKIETESMKYEADNVMLCSNAMNMRSSAEKNCAPMMMKNCAKKRSANFAVPTEYSSRVNMQNNLFSESGKAKEYCETQYYSYSNRSLYNSKLIVGDDLFFADLAEFWSNNANATLTHGFHSNHFLIKPRNLTHMLFVLSVLDLESQSGQQKFIKNEGLGLTIKATSNFYILTKEINETQMRNTSQNELMIAQIIHYDKNTTKQNEEEAEPTIFLANVVYKQTILVTNISNKPINCDILFQVPEGSIPVGNDDYTTIQTCSIPKFNSQLYNQSFYFPQMGTFNQYPAVASIDDMVAVKGPCCAYYVAQTLPKITPNSFSDVLEQGTKEEILNYIKKSDAMKQEDLAKIYWLSEDKEFYTALIDTLRSKMNYNEPIWYQGIKHKDIKTLKELFALKCKSKLKSLGHNFDCLFAKVDSTNNAHIFNHKDYYPILNSRVHKLSKAKSSILTVEFRQTYNEFISYLITLKEIDSETNMRFCYYLILQERIDDAQKIFERIDFSKFTEKSSLQLQYDYLTAYLDFSTGYPKFTKAREICVKYKDFPLTHWRDMFMEINDQLLEFDGIEKYDDMDALLEEQNEENMKKLNKLKGEKEEKLAIEIKNNYIDVVYSNISSLTVKYYLIDIELLFSRNPFMKKDMNDFSYVIPNEMAVYPVENDSKEKNLQIPIAKEYSNKNIYIEVSTDKKKEYTNYYSSLMKCSITESIGEVKVLSPDLKPMPKVYVKCFAELTDGNIEFYKDGYTDLRGRFNYVALNSDLISKVKNFSILIMCDEFGSITRQCKPPKIIFEQESTTENKPTVNYENFQNYRQEAKKKVLMLRKK